LLSFVYLRRGDPDEITRNYKEKKDSYLKIKNEVKQLRKFIEVSLISICFCLLFMYQTILEVSMKKWFLTLYVCAMFRFILDKNRPTDESGKPLVCRLQQILYLTYTI
jgi:hypothetical protein